MRRTVHSHERLIIGEIRRGVPMNHEFIQYRVTDQIAHVILDRPRYRNAQSRQLLEELDQAFEVAVNDSQVKVIILSASGDHFSAGHDLGTEDEKTDLQRRPMGEGLRGRYQRSRGLYVDFTLRWRDLPKPTIAVVQGYCIFGGWMIASAMDLVFAASDAMFLGTNFQYFSIPWDIHPRKAKEILFESRFIDGTEACDLGLVNHVYARDTVLEEAVAYAKRVALNDAFQLRMIKQAINQAQDSQGFKSHIDAAHNLHMLSSTAEKDPDFALGKPAGKRRPMVQQALKNYEIRRQQQQREQ